MRLIVSIGAFAAALSACAPRTQVVQGSCAKIHGADVCTWGEMKGSQVVSFGASIPIAAFTNAPKEPEMAMAWPPPADATIPLPDAVASGTGMKVLTVYFEPHGHPPKMMAVPHWDFHFYDISGADVAAINCADSSKPASLSSGYALPDMDLGPPVGMLVGLCVPGMGMHALLQHELTDTTAWTGSMVIGYYHQKPIFVEPMVSNALMLEKKSFSLAVPAIPGISATSHYPTQFRADYDSTAQTYKFVFSGMAGAGGK